MDFLYEECAQVIEQKSANTKFNTLRIISICSYILAVAWGFFVWFFFDWNSSAGVVFNILIAIVPLFLLILCGYLVGKYKNRFYADFDYILISGSIRISKVIHNTKRRDLFIFDTHDIEKIGMYNSETYCKYEQNINVIVNILTQNVTPAQNKDFYYMVVNTQGNKHLMVFECTKTFILNVVKFTSKKVLEQELLK